MDPSNAHALPIAGPSSLPPVVFQLPQPLPYPPQHLHSTHDLLAVFNLLPAYDKYVRPHVRPVGELEPSKGKGKEREISQSNAAGVDPAGGDEQEGGEKKKKKDSYRHLIKRTPGKHSTKKDNYFQSLMSAPPKQKIQIQPIDAKTLREGFSVSLTGLPSYNKAALEGTDPKEKELKRLKKERRKAEKEKLRLQQEQAQGSASGVSTPAAASTPRAAAASGSSVSHVRNVANATPVAKGSILVATRAGSARPGTPKPLTASAQQRTASTPATSQSVTGAMPGRAASNPAATGARWTQLGVTPETTAVANMAEKRGQKRELESQPPTPGGASAATTNGARPQKKRRVGSSTPQPMPLQQPTPHGT